MEIARLAEVMQDYGLYIVVTTCRGMPGFYVGNFNEDDKTGYSELEGVTTEGTDIEKAVYAYLMKIGGAVKIPASEEPVVLPMGYMRVTNGLVEHGDLAYFGHGDFFPVTATIIKIGDNVTDNYLIIRLNAQQIAKLTNFKKGKLP